ncbi:hypothetical protein MRB53_003979 [Persea americana]|uniref:Uncharacterized protein n=1 Tax=Persea americana TaxID=3435 RepID=A0ACC2MZ40_PERAE|nr:hypothetical protein MRB53_003979 [Persea americana]
MAELKQIVGCHPTPQPVPAPCPTPQPDCPDGSKPSAGDHKESAGDRNELSNNKVDTGNVIAVNHGSITINRDGKTNQQ